MIESVLRVIALSMGVLPLGILLAMGGIKYILNPTPVSGVFTGLAMVGVGALLVGGALVALAKGG